MYPPKWHRKNQKSQHTIQINLSQKTLFSHSIPDPWENPDQPMESDQEC